MRTDKNSLAVALLISYRYSSGAHLDETGCHPKLAWEASGGP